MKGTGTRAGWDYDVAVIGGGSAGYAAARTASSAGARTVLVEGADELGGLCILRGCMPTKALLWAAEIRQWMRNARTWGIDSVPGTFSWAEVLARKDALIREFAAYRRDQLTEGRFNLIRSRARFLDGHTLALGEGADRLTAGRFVVATGSEVSPPPLGSLKEAGVLTSDDLIHLPILPKSMIVLGGGAIALEFAQMLGRFGVEVTVIQRSARVLSGFDPDVAEALEEALRSEGITMWTGTELLGARREGEEKVVRFRHGETEREGRADAILLALGRRPHLDGLGLEAAGVAVEDGRIVTDARMRTRAGHVFAAGDCTGPHDIVHLAVRQGEVAGHNAVDPDRPWEMDDRLLTRVVFTEPQVAVVGLGEREAGKRGIRHRVARYRFEDHGKSLIMGARHGFVKLLADPAGRILGGACVGPMGGELIHEIGVAMSAGLTAAQLAAVPHYHPTLAEIWTYPAEELAEG